MSSFPKIMVVGAGVNGLCCGITLLEGGFTEVEIIAEDLSPHTTSDIAAAIWRPSHMQNEHLAKWCETSLSQLMLLSKNTHSGVSWVTRTEFYREFTSPVWQNLVEHVKPAAKMPAAYQHMLSYKVPLMDTTIYMDYLINSFVKLGGKINQEKIKAWQDIKAADVIVNCSGLGALDLAKDESVYPIRGQVVVVERPARFTASIAAPEDFIYIIARKNDCIVGGTAEKNDWHTKPDPKIAKQIMAQAAEIYPAITKQKIIGHKVGLRPGRPSVRLESDWDSQGRLLIHNYGHGGAGHSLSWGCAKAVLELILFGN
ncbi:MAG: FAD-dependent oxidoreductase [Gammaproteobacteria bacterium]|nr:FAD-dependent oxidoreductase [Gammaproteobacteria bacterium]